MSQDEKNVEREEAKISPKTLVETACGDGKGGETCTKHGLDAANLKNQRSTDTSKDQPA